MYVGLMAVVFVLFFRDGGLIGIMAGLLVSGPLYLGFGYVLAKLGYQRKTWRQLRTETPARGGRRSAGSAPEPERPRAKPAPTSRTGGGGNRPGGSRKKRR